MNMFNFFPKSLGFILLFVFLVGDTASGAKYSGEFLELGVSARSLGMGGAYTAIAQDASSPFYNPAGLAEVRDRSVMFMHAETFGSLINHDYLGGVMPVRNSSAGLGAALIRIGGGNIKITELTVDDPNSPYGQRFGYSKTESHADYTAFLSYGTKWSKNLQVGLTTKIIYRDIATESAYGLGVDLGVRSRLYKNLWGAAVLKDATATFLSYSTGTTESIYPNLKLGLAYGFSKSDFIFNLAGDASIKFEHRDESAQLSVGGASSDFMIGGEVIFRNRIAGRVGAFRGDLTAGAGIKLGRFTIDAAFLTHDELDNSYRVNLIGTF
ncbi:MAG: PorV/PorQ family protein [candidate division Zixibacteria bacterium]|nr:PorV/PorQ family protein [candidate division Zixibacteria bacterium]